MAQEVFEQTFQIEGPAQLKIANVRGSVDVRPGEEGEIQVEAVKHTDTGNAEQTEVQIEQENDGRVVVASKYEKSWGGFLNLDRPCKMVFTVRVPKQCSIKASCVSSTASIQGLEGEFKFSTVSGALNLKDLTGPIKLSSVSGAVKAEGLDGELEMGNVSGKIRVIKSHLPSAVGKTVSGHLTLETSLGNGPYDFNSVSGGFKLIAPEDTGCTVRLKSVSGHVSSSLPITRREKVGANKTIEIQNGGTAINIRSVSGNFKLVSGSNSESQKGVEIDRAEENPLRSEGPQKSSLDILQQIEAGEISVDEALRELNA